MKEQYPIEFNEMVKDFLDSVMNEFDMSYPTAHMSDREVRLLFVASRDGREPMTPTYPLCDWRDRPSR